MHSRSSHRLLRVALPWCVRDRRVRNEHGPAHALMSQGRMLSYPCSRPTRDIDTGQNILARRHQSGFQAGGDGVKGSLTAALFSSAMHSVCQYLVAGPRRWQGRRVTASRKQGCAQALTQRSGLTAQQCTQALSLPTRWQVDGLQVKCE